MSSRKLEPLIATSPEITIMPPDDGEDMAPTQRFDEAEDDDGVNRQTHQRWTVSMTSGPRPGRGVDDASRWGSTAREREGTRYLGIPPTRSPWTAHCHPTALASGSRDSPNIETLERRSAFRVENPGRYAGTTVDWALASSTR
jgi:hypothetical protein